MLDIVFVLFGGVILLFCEIYRLCNRIKFLNDKIEWYRVEWNNMAVYNDRLEECNKKLEEEIIYRSNSYKDLKEKFILCRMKKNG